MSLDGGNGGVAPEQKRLGQRVWVAQMLAPLADAGVNTRASFLRQSFAAPAAGPLLLHISALGLYRAFINGVRVGADLLTPGLTCYDDRVAYQTYDVSPLLRPGQNRIDIWLADGWYRSPILWRDTEITNCWGDRIAAIAEITAGAAVVLATDATWVSGPLPVTRSGIYYGEDHDARLEVLEPSAGAEVLAFDTAKLVAHETAPVVEMAAIAPVATWQDPEGRWVYDFGQNLGGVVRFTVQGAAGASVRVDHSEVLGPDRAFDNRNYRGARGASAYTLKGGPAETWQPVFTFMGYRYARVTITGAATITAIQSVPITSVPTLAGDFTCGVPAVNRLVQNTIWSQRSNFIEIPTDCPQRDERLGWTGDAQVFAGTAAWLADVETFLAKFLRDVMHDQRPSGAIAHFSPDPTRLHPIKGRGDWAGSTGWGDAITVIPWQIYLHYGDAGVLRETFPAMLRWLDYLWNISGGPVIRPSTEWGGRGFTFGDWLQPVGDNRKPRPTIGDDCAATLYHAISTRIAADVADVIGDTAQATRLRARFADIKAAFAHEFIPPSGRLAHDDQTSYALAFLYDLIPDAHHAAAKARFRHVVEGANHLIGTGFIGTPALLPALTKLGMTDLAEKVFLNRKVPGWLYQVEQGATTIWERWDAIAPDGMIYEPDMNSYNHYAYGAVCQWLFESVAGVAPAADTPGFDTVVIDPQILAALAPVSIWHDCRHGRIDAGWTLSGRSVTYTVTLPKGCTGRVIGNPNHSNYHLNGAAIAPGQGGLSLPSGRHVITFDLNL